MLINIHCAKCIGIEAVPVVVEVDIASGIGIHLVGLADAAVKESLLRTVTALQSLGFRIPGKKIVINLAPADMHKKGSGYDLPIALGIIAASRQRDLPLLEKFLVMGELGLDGAVKEIPGALPLAELAAKEGLRGCILPLRSAVEAVEIPGVDIYGVQDLEEVLRVLSGEELCDDLLARRRMMTGSGRIGLDRRDDSMDAFLDKKISGDDTDSWDIVGPEGAMDFADIIGQEGAKRGVEIAASGGHNIIMFGYLNTTPYLCRR